MAAASLKQREFEIVFAVQDSPEGGLDARALGHAIFTHAPDYKELKAMVRDAVACHFEAAERPRTIHLHWVRDEVISS